MHVQKQKQPEGAETFVWDGVGYVPLELIREAMEITARKLEDRIYREGIETFTDPRDRRKRLVKSSDVVRLTAPMPVVRRSERLRHKVS